MAKYDARIMYAIPTPGLAEVEPSMNWNPSVVAGIGVVADPAQLYQDMHFYLAGSGDTSVLSPRCLSIELHGMEWWGVYCMLSLLSASAAKKEEEGFY